MEDGLTQGINSESAIKEPRKLRVRDPLHDLQLLRDLAIINERIQRELGPLPASGLPVEPKRKPKPHRVDAMDNSNVEDEAMKFSHVTVAATIGIASTLAACGAGIALPESGLTSHRQEIQAEDRSTHAEKGKSTSALTSASSLIAVKDAATTDTQRHQELATQVNVAEVSPVLRSSYDECIKASDGVMPEIQDCIRAEFEYQDAYLNRVYEALMMRLDERMKISLRDEQRKWIAERDKQCAYDPESGQAGRLDASECRLEMTASRAAELAAR